MYQIAAAKADITPKVLGIAMMGYSVPHNIVRGIASPLYARAIIIKDKKSKGKVCMVNAEICFYSIALKDAIVKRLQKDYSELNYTDKNLMLSAQHTHSAPGGYSHYLLYNLAIPGFQAEVFNTIVKGTVKAIVQAEQQLQDGQIKFIKGTFDDNTDIAFNRSLKAYNSNPEIKKKVLKKDHHKALDRTMKLLRFETANGEALACWNWFGVHTTSIDNDNDQISSDNKGFAAKFLEKYIHQEQQPKDTGQPRFIAVFAQDTAGDVSPNHQYDGNTHWKKGKYHDDFKSAAYNGKLQYQKAKTLLENTQEQESLSGEIDCELIYVNFSNVHIDREFVNGKTGLCTCPAATGVALMTGASDRPPAKWIVNQLIGLSLRFRVGSR